MKNNNYLQTNLERVARQILRHYVKIGLEGKISAIVVHQDDGCPCINVELEPLDLVDFWKWVQATDEKGDLLIGNENKPYNRWQMESRGKLSDQEKAEEKEMEEVEA